MVMRCSGSLSDIWLTMAVKCSTDPVVYDNAEAIIKDFGSVIVSFFSVVVSALSLGLARRVSKITNRQKEINEQTYDLNLFKERFGLYSDFIKLDKDFPRNENNLDIFLNRDKEYLHDKVSLLRKIPFLFGYLENISEYTKKMKDLIDGDFSLTEDIFEISSYCKILVEKIQDDISKERFSLYRIKELESNFDSISKYVSYGDKINKSLEYSIKNFYDRLLHHEECSIIERMKSIDVTDDSINLDNIRHEIFNKSKKYLKDTPYHKNALDQIKRGILMNDVTNNLNVVLSISIELIETLKDKHDKNVSCKEFFKNNFKFFEKVRNDMEKKLIITHSSDMEK